MFATASTPSSDNINLTPVFTLFQHSFCSICCWCLHCRDTATVGVALCAHRRVSERVPAARVWCIPRRPLGCLETEISSSNVCPISVCPRDFYPSVEGQSSLTAAIGRAENEWMNAALSVRTHMRTKTVNTLSIKGHVYWEHSKRRTCCCGYEDFCRKYWHAEKKMIYQF